MKLTQLAFIIAATIPIAIVGFTLSQKRASEQPIAKVAVTAPTAPRASIPGVSAENVYSEDNVQVIEIFAKGGYSPATSTAKSMMPTVLRIVTDETFDCSSSLVIPEFRIRRRLPLTGKTDIQLPKIAQNTNLTVYCGMGMYSFNLNFVG